MWTGFLNAENNSFYIYILFFKPVVIFHSNVSEMSALKPVVLLTEFRWEFLLHYS